MKKKIALLLAATMTLSAAVTGCGDKKDDTEATTAKSTETQTEKVTEATTAATEEVTTEEVTTEEVTEAPAPMVGASSSCLSVAVQDITWDEQNVRFKVVCTNNDTDSATFDFDRIVVNGCEWYGGIYETVEAGQTVEVEAEIRQDSNSIFKTVDAYQFTEVQEIVFYPDINTKDRDESKGIFETFKAYPTGLSEGQVQYPQYTPKDTDIVIIDEQNVKVIITSINPRSYTDIYYLYVENNSDKAITVSPVSEGYSENGEETKPVSNFIQLEAGERSSNIIYLHGKEITNFKGAYGVSDLETDRWGRDPFITGSFDINVADYDLDNEE